MGCFYFFTNENDLAQHKLSHNDDDEINIINKSMFDKIKLDHATKVCNMKFENENTIQFENKKINESRYWSEELKMGFAIKKWKIRDLIKSKMPFTHFSRRRKK